MDIFKKLKDKITPGPQWRYEKELIDGITIGYSYINGELVGESRYKLDENNLRQGKNIDYHIEPTGEKILTEESFYKNDKLHGYCKNWYNSGKIERESKWVEGIPVGLQKTYFENGSIESEENYEDEYPYYPIKWIHYSKNGNFDIIFNFYNQISTEVEFPSNREILVGYLLKDKTKYFDNGNIWEELSFNNKSGWLNGYSRGYYKSGSLDWEGNFKEELKDSYWKYYNENGTLEKSGEYDSGKQIGWWTFYNGYGEEIRKENYGKGKESDDELRSHKTLFDRWYPRV